MTCPGCGQVAAVYIARNAASGFKEAYCSECRRFISLDGAQCTGCGQDVFTFERTGSAACPACYSLRRVKEYVPAGVSEVWRDAHINERASLAQARTQELVEWVMKDQATPPSEAACIVESHDPLADAFVRVRIARNIQGIPFCPGLSAGQKVRLASFITGPRSHLYDFLAQGSLPGVTAWRCYSDDEDHLRVEWIYRSLPSAADVRGLEAAVAAIDGMFAYAMSPELGYLTSCPKNAGGGIKASIRLSGAWQDGALRRQIRRAGVETAKKGHDVVAMMRVAHPNHLASALVQLSSLATPNQIAPKRVEFPAERPKL